MILPKKDKEGLYYLSYSQINSWNELRGFNTGMLGKHEYIRSYFLGEKHPQNSFAQFGIDIESYITERKGKEKFTKEELTTLDSIQPLGVFQHEFKLKYNGFYIWGFIDDSLPDFSKVRDYKSCSLKSSEKYHKEDYDQLDVYAMAIKQETGKIPDVLEVCAIERTGNGFKGGRDVLKVGENIWYIDRTTTPERLAKLEDKIQRTVKEIAHYYEVFLKLNK